VAVRILQTLLVAPWPPGIFNDEAYYHTLAKLIARGDGYVRPGEAFGQGLLVPTAERPPLYPAAIAVVDFIGGGADAQRLLGSVTGGVTIATVGVLGRRLVGPRAGLIAAGLAAGYPTLIAADGALMTESLYGMLTALALLAAYRLRETPGAARAALLGGILGLAALARGEALLLFPLLLIPLLRRPRALATAAVAALAFAVVIAPWTVRNWIELDHPVLVATEGGQTLAGANCDQAYHGDRIGTWVFTCVHLAPGGDEVTEGNQAAREGLDYARDHIGRVPVVLAVRAARTWGVFWPGQVAEGRAKWVTYAGVGVYFVLLPLAVWGLVLLRRRGVGVWIVAAPCVTATLTTLLSYGSVRFRHSAEISVVVLAAVALDRAWRGVAARRLHEPPPV
jgi:4-amino-4-deoxy-L-arabinose transferase-like glycosyltransferase